MIEHRRQPLWPATVIAAIALVCALFQLEVSKPWNPVSDEVGYLSYAHTLAFTGQFAATAAGPQADLRPGREPIYPAFIAAIMQVDPVLARNGAHCIGNQTDPACPSIYRSLRWANVALIALVAALTYLSARMLDLGRVACWTAGLYVALNLEMMKSVRYVISDYLAMAIAAALAFAITLVLARRPSAWRWLSVGFLMALLILTKGIYEIYALCGVATLAVVAAIRRDRVACTALITVTVSTGVLVGSWVIRNDVIFGRPVLTDSRGAIALSTREELDHMSTGQYVAAFLWWLRGPGEGLARALLPENDWHRFELYAPDGYYMMGQVTNYENRVRTLMDQRGLSQLDAEAAIPGVIVREIMGEFPAYVATTLPVFYRGLWFDEFIVLGFPALVWFTVRSIRRRNWAPLAAVSPSWFSLVAYALLSLNIGRYQYTAVTGLALAGGVAVQTLWPRLRNLAIRARRSTPSDRGFEA